MLETYMMAQLRTAKNQRTTWVDGHPEVARRLLKALRLGPEFGGLCMTLNSSLLVEREP